MVTSAITIASIAALTIAAILYAGRRVRTVWQADQARALDAEMTFIAALQPSPSPEPPAETPARPAPPRPAPRDSRHAVERVGQCEAPEPEVQPVSEKGPPTEGPAAPPSLEDEMRAFFGAPQD